MDYPDTRLPAISDTKMGIPKVPDSLGELSKPYAPPGPAPAPARPPCLLHCREWALRDSTPNRLPLLDSRFATLERRCLSTCELLLRADTLTRAVGTPNR